MTSFSGQEHGAGDREAIGPADRAAKASDELQWLHGLWQISHFGWTAEATIRRGLSIGAGAQIAASALADHLQLLLERGWAEQRDSGAGSGEHEWRLTSRGRDAHAAAQHGDRAAGT